MICKWCADRLKLAAQTAHLMIGLPDYENYAAHRQLTHPGEPVMTRAEFFRERQDSRYGGKGRSNFRCC